jgi:hypothetical protein
VAPATDGLARGGVDLGDATVVEAMALEALRVVEVPLLLGAGSDNVTLRRELHRQQKLGARHIRRASLLIQVLVENRGEIVSRLR